jgi:uncharacterized protein (DUF362 family)/Pyruvate/2-oxoacid:ferredoxin oxidoreductase delta subunit
MKTTISIIPCGDYDRGAVLEAVAEAAKKAGGLEVAGKTVLLKPNMLATADIDSAVTTHPEILRASIRLVRSLGAKRVLVGDSPAFQSGDAVGIKCGLKPVALEEGAEWVDFSETVEVAVPGGQLVKRFALATVVTEVDVVISVCRLKNHSFMHFTGAVKNLFGAIAGLQKSAFHLRFPGKPEFGAMLADLMLAVKPQYAIMDAIVGMEGPGPRNGTPKKVGYVLAGTNLFALDWIASSIVGYDPLDIPYLKAAAANPVYSFDPSGIVTAGLTLEQALRKDFKRVPIVADSPLQWKGPIRGLFRNLGVPRPFFSREKCVLCGACVKICPADALSVSGENGSERFIAIDYGKCLRCYCCHEVCPEDAIALKRRL